MVQWLDWHLSPVGSKHKSPNPRLGCMKKGVQKNLPNNSLCGAPCWIDKPNLFFHFSSFRKTRQKWCLLQFFSLLTFNRIFKIFPDFTFRIQLWHKLQSYWEAFYSSVPKTPTNHQQSTFGKKPLLGNVSQTVGASDGIWWESGGTLTTRQSWTINLACECVWFRHGWGQKGGEVRGRTENWSMK